MRISNEPTPLDCTQPILQSATLELQKLWFDQMMRNLKDTSDKGI